MSNSQTIYQQPQVIYQQPTIVNPSQSTTTVKQTRPPRAGAWEWVILIIVIILVIGVIIWMIWYFGFRSIGKPPGHVCSANSDCEVGTYCSASGICEPGEGDKEGDRCDISSDCIIGLTCDLDTRICTRSIGPL